MQGYAEASGDRGDKSVHHHLSSEGFLSQIVKRNSKISRTDKSYGQAGLMARFWRWQLDQQMRTKEISGIFTRSPANIIKFIRGENLRREHSSQNNNFLVKGEDWGLRRLKWKVFRFWELHYFYCKSLKNYFWKLLSNDKGHLWLPDWCIKTFGVCIHTNSVYTFWY